MAASAINVLSGIGAAVAGLAGEKVSKSGSIPGFDLAAIIPALLGQSGGTAGSIAGMLTSAVAKSGLIKGANIAQLAGSLLSIGKGTETTTTKKTAADGIAGLASAILGNSGKGADLSSIASLATTLAGTAKDEKGLLSMATKLGKLLSSSGGVSFEGSGTALKALDSIMGGDTKGDLFKAVLKGLG